MSGASPRRYGATHFFPRFVRVRQIPQHERGMRRPSDRCIQVASEGEAPHHSRRRGGRSTSSSVGKGCGAMTRTDTPTGWTAPSSNYLATRPPPCRGGGLAARAQLILPAVTEASPSGSGPDVGRSGQAMFCDPLIHQTVNVAPSDRGATLTCRQRSGNTITRQISGYWLRTVHVLSVRTMELKDASWVRRLTITGGARALRQAARVSASEVARQIGASPSTVCRWERGERRPTGDVGARYVRLLRDLAGAEVIEPLLIKCSRGCRRARHRARHGLCASPRGPAQNRPRRAEDPRSTHRA